MLNSIIDSLQNNRENTIYFKKDIWVEYIKGSSNYQVQSNWFEKFGISKNDEI